MPHEFHYAPGARIGPYEVLGPLGAGGMGEVYRSRDPRLGRDVAIKVLHAGVVADPERRRRFEAEARAASALNHPNILAIYDIGEQDGAPYIVSELVDGQSLRQLLRQEELNPRQVLEIAVQIADALAAAHQAGIVHRDLKPENTMVTGDSRVKVLDFGLAKFAAPAGENTETLTGAGTHPGVILGTIGYMSPEQARGGVADYRSDQFCLGLVMYEMAARRRAFERASGVETLSAIINDDPEPLEKLNPRIPPPLRWIVERCVSKDPRQRYQSTLDLYHDLRMLRDRYSEAVTRESMAAPAARPKRKLLRPLLAVAGMLACFAIGASLGDAPAPELRFTPIATEAGAERFPAWSPDGKALAYTREVDGVLQVFTRALESSVPAQITKSAANCSVPIWSPDSNRIFYTSELKLWSVGAAGGPPRLILEDAQQSELSPDGKHIAFGKPAAGGGIFIHSLVDGTTQPYRNGPTGQSPQRQLHFSRDGKTIGALWPLQQEHAIHRAFWILPFPEGPTRQITLEASSFSWMPDGRHVVAARQPPGEFGLHLYMVDTRDARVRPITTGVGHETQPAVSPDGKRIAFSTGGTESDLLEIPIEGGAVRTLLGSAQNEDNPAWSPDGSQYAYVQNAAGSGDEVWLRSVTGAWSKPLLSGQARESGEVVSSTSPQFSPDGQRIAYERWSREGHLIWVSNVAGGPPLRLVTDNNHQHSPAWSSDGNWIAYRANRGTKRILEKAPAGGGPPVPICDVSTASSIHWSPSGEWIAYAGATGIQVVTPEGKGNRLLAQQRETVFGFSKDGSRILTLRRAGKDWKLWSIDVKNGEAKLLRDVELPPLSQASGFSLHPDGKRFVTAVGSSREDIWMLEGFERRREWWRFW